MNVKYATTHELLELLGYRGSVMPAELAAQAEAELMRRTASEEEIFRKKVHNAGAGCAVIGGFMACWGLLMALFGVFFFHEMLILWIDVDISSKAKDMNK